MSAPIVLYSFADHDRSAKVRWTAHELGIPVEERRVAPGEHLQPPYLALNPLGQVPTAQWRGLTLTESTATCLWLAEQHDHPPLWIRPDEPERQAFLWWLAAVAETCEGRVVDAAISRAGMLPEAHGQLQGRLVRRRLGAVVDALPAAGWLCGERFTVADVVAGYALVTAVQAELLPLERVEGYLARLQERPAAVASGLFARLSG